MYCCRYRFDIDRISSCTCWINCIVVDIDTISFCDCMISCNTVNIVDIVNIDSISIKHRFVLVGSTVLLSSTSSILIRYRHVTVRSAVLRSISSISIRYRNNFVFWLLDQLYCYRYHWYRPYCCDIDTISFIVCCITCIAVDIDTI